MDKAERFNFVAYGSLLALLGAFASATQVLVTAVEFDDSAAISTSVLLYDVLIQAARRVPEFGETRDFRKQMIEMLELHHRYAQAIMLGSDRAAILREIGEGRSILDLAFAQLGRRLGIGE